MGDTSQLKTDADRSPCPIHRDKLAPKFCEVVLSTLAVLEEILAKVMDVVQSLCCAPDRTEDIELALREALANAILHGNQSDPGKQVIVACFCECEAGGGGFLLVVRDEGAGFDPAEVPDPTTATALYLDHGRGIFLMRQVMDEVRYLKGGSEVEMRKYTNQPEGRCACRDELRIEQGC